MVTRQIILASTSPRRKELLARIGLKFKVVVSDYEEDMNSKLKPLALAKFLAKGKAVAVAGQYKNHIIIAADTFVALNNQILGKPYTESKAVKMLKKISGRCLMVITGTTIIDTLLNKKSSWTTVTKVYIKKLSAKEIRLYVKSKEPLDKAGAFAIQGIGAFMVKKIDGDFFNVIGLPLFSLVESLKKFDVNILL